MNSVLTFCTRCHRTAAFLRLREYNAFGAEENMLIDQVFYCRLDCLRLAELKMQDWKMRNQIPFFLLPVVNYDRRR